MSLKKQEEEASLTFLAFLAGLTLLLSRARICNRILQSYLKKGVATALANDPLPTQNDCLQLGCHKWGFKRWGFKEIRGYLRKKAFFLRFLDFPGALRTLRKRAKKAEKGRFWPISADFQEGRPDTP